jgi:hypothetical protein
MSGLLQGGEDRQDGNGQRNAIRPQPDGDNHHAIGVRMPTRVFHLHPSEVLPMSVTSRAVAEGAQRHVLACFQLTGAA